MGSVLVSLLLVVVVKFGIVEIFYGMIFIEMLSLVIYVFYKNFKVVIVVVFLGIIVISGDYNMVVVK